MDTCRSQTKPRGKKYNIPPDKSVSNEDLIETLIERTPKKSKPKTKKRKQTIGT